MLAQDFGIHDEQIKAYMRKRVESEEATDKSYEEKISEAKDRLEDAETPEKKEEIMKELEALEPGAKPEQRAFGRVQGKDGKK